MSLLLHYNFNENDNSVVYDYSTNGKDAITINNLVIASGDLGFAGRFNGATTDIIFGDVGGVGGTDKVSVFCKFNKDADKVQYLVYKREHFRLYLNGTGKLIFEVFIGGGWFGSTSDLTFSDSTWYNVLAVYDGAKIYIYVAGLEDVSTVKTGNIDASIEDFIIGSDTANYFDGDIEQVEVWNTAHTATQALAHSNNPIGIKYKTLKDHSLDLGDLISVDTYDSPVNMVITYKDDSTIYRAIPITGRINFGQTPVRRGNIYQTDRQWIAEFVIESNEPVLQFYDGIKNFSPSNQKIKITKSGILLPSGSNSTFPLKFTSGDLLTTPEVGAMEFLNNDLYFSISASKSNIAQYPPAHNNTYVKATSKITTNVWWYYATDPAKALTGVSDNNAWLSATDTNQRFHIDLGSAKIIVNVMYHPWHASGGQQTQAVKEFTMWGSNTAADFADLVYNNDGTWTQLTTSISQLEQHIVADVPDPKEFTVTNTVAYRYYAFKFANSWGSGDFMGMRHIELQIAGTDFRKGIILNDGDDLVSGRIPYASTNGRLIDSDDLLFDEDGMALKKDLLFIGAGSGLIMGSMSANDNSTTTSVSSAEFTQVTIFSKNGHNNNTTPDHTNNHILIDIAGLYMCSVCATITNQSGAGHKIELVVAKNNGSTIFSNMRRHRTLASSTDAGALPICNHIQLAVNDTVEVWVTSDSGASKSIIIEDISINLTLVGGM